MFRFNSELYVYLLVFSNCTPDLTIRYTTHFFFKHFLRIKKSAKILLSIIVLKTFDTRQITLEE